MLPAQRFRQGTPLVSATIPQRIDKLEGRLKQLKAKQQRVEARKRP